MKVGTLVISIVALGFVPALPCAADGPIVYRAQCARCHGNDGLADTTVAKVMKVPALAGNQKLAAAAPADIAKMVKENQKHAAFVGKMSPEDIDVVAAYVKGLPAPKADPKP